MIIILLFVCTIASEPLITREYEEKLRKEVTWEVEEYENNIFKGWTLDDFLEAFPNEEEGKPIEGVTIVDKGEEEPATQAPTSFDARTKWPKCIHPIRRQGKCGSCWAFALTGVMSDRFCIRGKDVLLSPQDLVSCNTRNQGCQGGSIYIAMDYMTTNGISTDACFPYVCENTLNPPKCPTACPGKGDWSHRFHCAKGSQKYITKVAAMMDEIYKNGPLVTHQKYHKSFNYYKGGIYTCDNELQIAGHFMRVLGWGAQNGISYWIIANSFGPVWGEKGYVRFKMDVCGINEYMGACEPLIK
jgi:cathepsin B